MRIGSPISAIAAGLILVLAICGACYSIKKANTIYLESETNVSNYEKIVDYSRKHAYIRTMAQSMRVDGKIDNREFYELDRLNDALDEQARKDEAIRNLEEK